MSTNDSLGRRLNGASVNAALAETGGSACPTVPGVFTSLSRLQKPCYLASVQHRYLVERHDVLASRGFHQKMVQN